MRELITCADQSLVLIDELELALHPKAQIELLQYLTDIAQQKQLTIIFSTHSVSLLKRVPRQNILFLEQIDGVVSVLKGCYPTYALGGIAYDEERAPDVVIYVEDEAALYVTEPLVRLCISHRLGQQVGLFPTVHVVPIGAFINVVRFLTRGQALLPVTTASSALLDQDVQTESLATWQREQNYTALAEFQQHANRIQYLPWTPEVGLITFFQDHQADAERSIREHFQDHRLSIRQQEIGQIPAMASGQQRRACKSAVGRVIHRLAGSLPNSSEEQVRKGLFEVFAKWYFQRNRAAILQLIAPLL